MISRNSSEDVERERQGSETRQYGRPGVTLSFHLRYAGRCLTFFSLLFYAGIQLCESWQMLRELKALILTCGKRFRIIHILIKIVYSLPRLDHSCKFSLKSGLPPHLLVMGPTVTAWARVKGLAAREARAHENNLDHLLACHVHNSPSCTIRCGGKSPDAQG